MFTVTTSEYSSLETTRREVSQKLDPTRRGMFGQFMTPSSIAPFMSSLFTYKTGIKLLDPGAGIGSLTSAFLEVAIQKNLKIDVETWEIDSGLRTHLQETLDYWKAKSHEKVTSMVHPTDFIEDACFILG